MPAELIPQCGWYVAKLLTSLADAKLYPVKLTQMKHQSQLSSLALLSFPKVDVHMQCSLAFLTRQLEHSLTGLAPFQSKARP